jgi:hypothetical protein
MTLPNKDALRRTVFDTGIGAGKRRRRAFEAGLAERDHDLPEQRKNTRTRTQADKQRCLSITPLAPLTKLPPDIWFRTYPSGLKRAA